MGGGTAYSSRLGGPRSFAPVAAALTIMFAASLAQPGPVPYTLATVPVLAVLALGGVLGLDGWALTYVSLALSLFYSSISLPATALIPAYAVLVTRYVAGLPMRASAGGVVGPSSAAVLRPLPFFLFAALANYRVVFAVAFLAASVLILSLARYVTLLGSRVLGVSHDREVGVGRPLRVRVTIDSPRTVHALLTLGDYSRMLSIEAPTTAELRLVPREVGRHTLTLKVAVLDDWFAASRTVAEIPVTFTALPTYAALARRLQRELPPAPTLLGEPVRTRVFISGRGWAGVGEVGEGEFIRYLRLLPQPLRSVARALLPSMAPGGRGPGTWPRGRRRGVFGEYYGARDFVPGDDPRAIHWKKSVSRGRLVVKEYVAGESVSGGSLGMGRYAPIVIADLTPSSGEELDRLAASLLNVLRTAAKRSRGTNMLLITVFGDALIALEGPIEDVAARVAEAFTRIAPVTVHEYVTIAQVVGEEVAEALIAAKGCCRLIGVIAHTAQEYARRVAEEIIAYGLPPPKPVVLIHGAPTAVRNALLGSRLREAGYEVTNPLIARQGGEGGGR